ncbi:MAG: CoA pyrophosphatase [Deltaproteobacteria bacterium]|nr:CoA pyrophosphatase [Deltaproteobacteria bacterium]
MSVENKCTKEDIMDFDLFKSKNGFPDRVMEGLGNIRVDFHEKLNYINSLRKANESHLAAGILLILEYKESGNPLNPGEGEFFFQFIKRSDVVPQPGDLSCPGGRLDRFLDPLLSILIMSGMFPVVRGRARVYASERGRDHFRTIRLFLATALRESWEEIGISPFNISFLGALPSYTFSPARRTIFPVAGMVKRTFPLRLNEEVEKMVDIPVRAFFDEANFANFIIEPPLPERQSQDYPPAYPCLVFTDKDGHEEILWGATYNIVMDFLHMTLGHRQPDTAGRRTISRSLHPDYMRYLNHK